MKKRDLWTGLCFILAGLACLARALLWETPLGSLLCGLCGAFTVPGVVQIIKYVKWTSPKNAPIYQERLEQEQISLRDERKAMLRDKAGRYAYILGLALVLIAEMVFAVLMELGVIGQEEGLLIILLLAGYLVIEYLAGVVIFRCLEKKY